MSLTDPFQPVDRKGFTLLEVLLAVVLMVTASVFLLQAIGTGLFSGGVNESELIAFNLAAERMESLENTAYASIINEAKTVVSGFPLFQRQVAVTTPQTDLKQITVTTYWTVKGTEISTALVTYSSNA